jgi:hypothetical protein
MAIQAVVVFSFRSDAWCLVLLIKIIVMASSSSCWQLSPETTVSEGKRADSDHSRVRNSKVPPTKMTQIQKERETPCQEKARER